MRTIAVFNSCIHIIVIIHICKNSKGIHPPPKWSVHGVARLDSWEALPAKKPQTENLRTKQISYEAL